MVLPQFAHDFNWRVKFRVNTPFHKFTFNMRLLLQFPVDLSALLTVNPLLKMSKDEKRAFS